MGVKISEYTLSSAHQDCVDDKIIVNGERKHYLYNALMLLPNEPAKTRRENEKIAMMEKFAVSVASNATVACIHARQLGKNCKRISNVNANEFN